MCARGDEVFYEVFSQETTNRKPELERKHDMKDLQCYRCRHYQPDEESYPNWQEDQRNGCGQGTCRRHCPAAQIPDEDERIVNYGYWPIVLSGDWCGEFEPARLPK